jgi:hypothetical protein
MTRRRFLLNGTTTTEAGSFRSVGTGFNHRMEDCRTGERVFGRGIGLRLPDGEKLSSHISRGRARDRTDELRDSEGTVVIELSWLPPASTRLGPFSNGQAALALELQPSVDLVPLLSYAFQWFQYACQPKGGG